MSRRQRTRIGLRVESLETKSTPSPLVPMLSQNTLNQVLHQIDLAAGTYSKTQNPVQFDAALARISSRIPYGRTQLYPAWQNDEGIYTGVRDGSGLQMIHQITLDLVSHVRQGVFSGAFRFR